MACRCTWALLVVAGCGRLSFEARGDGGGDDGGGPDVAQPSVYAQTVLADGPVAYWRLGEGTGTLRDATGHGHDGMAVGGVQRGQLGLLAGDNDHAVAFDGATGYATVPDDPALRLSTALTLEAWIRGTDFTNTASEMYPRIIQKGAGSVVGYTLCLGTNGTDAFVRFELQAAGPVFAFNGLTPISPAAIHHLAATYDGAQMIIYLDGAVDDTRATSGPVATNTSDLEIGRRPDGVRYFDGAVDEVAVYDKVLTSQQIAAHAAAGR